MQRYGVKNGEHIIIYSDLEKPQMASRLLWALQNYGATNTQILDGQFNAWLHNNYKTESGVMREIEISDFIIQSLDKSIHVDISYVIERLYKVKLMDARPCRLFQGEETDEENKRAGHIVNVSNVCFLDTIDKNGYFLPIDRLRNIFSEEGLIEKDEEIIVYCQRGHRASHVWFVLEHLLGFTNVKVYDGSMIEWSNREDTPMEI